MEGNGTIPVKQTIYRGVQIRVQSAPGAPDCLLIVDAPGEQIVLPLDPQSRDVIGRALLAPHVHVPSSAAHPNGR